MLCFAIEAKGLKQGELLQGRRAAAFISTLAARGAQPLRQELGRNQRRGFAGGGRAGREHELLGEFLADIAISQILQVRP